MVLGKQGLRFEGYKFALYIMVPVAASISFNDPEVRKKAVDYFQFLKYPANPNTNLVKEYEELRENEMKKREQLKAYREEVKKLRELNDKRQELFKETEDLKGGGGNSSGGRKWFSWFRRSE
uniref:Uncharacterized protein n=1 Tax=Ditylum brightwellii TaxID=49249 RepID=A0A6S9A6Z6_9STRA|mmetsp:Transcript_32160/g.46853  ORF Transcript_32160/g.46853 Transcript_32160/m.46853 type:complete len:122 (-) Transcript_32160:369-734(-)